MDKKNLLKQFEKFNEDNNVIRWREGIEDFERIQDKEYIKLLQLYLKKYEKLDEADKYLFRNFIKLYQTIALII